MHLEVLFFQCLYPPTLNKKCSFVLMLFFSLSSLLIPLPPQESKEIKEKEKK